MVVWLWRWTVGGARRHLLLAVEYQQAMKLYRLLQPVSRSGADILGFGRSKEYDLPSVKNLRIAFTLAEYQFDLPTQSLGDGGTIAFDYGAKTFRFGGGLDEAEASHLIELLKSRYPFDAAASQ